MEVKSIDCTGIDDCDYPHKAHYSMTDSSLVVDEDRKQIQDGKRRYITVHAY